jgi:putative membrane protein
VLRLVTAGLVVALAVSGWRPHDRLTWLLEILPILIVLPILWATRRSFPLTTLLYAGILVHGIVLATGGAYTYARVPLGFQVADWLHMARNPYDKIGHFVQGFVPALAIREILIRGDHVRGRKMRVFVTLSIVLAISAAYELLEWASALALGQGADEFLGTQGDMWDTQSDMFAAVIGGVCALLLLSRVHDRQVERLGRPLS